MVIEMLEQMECFLDVGELEMTVISLERLIDGLSTFGYTDIVKPKQKKNFDFKHLDMKSIRIMNRLTKIVF